MSLYETELLDAILKGFKETNTCVCILDPAMRDASHLQVMVFMLKVRVIDTLHYCILVTEKISSGSKIMALVNVIWISLLAMNQDNLENVTRI